MKKKCGEYKILDLNYLSFYIFPFCRFPCIPINNINHKKSPW